MTLHHCSKALGRLDYLKEKDAVWGNEKLTYYLFFLIIRLAYLKVLSVRNLTLHILPVKQFYFCPYFISIWKNISNKKVVVNGTHSISGNYAL